MANFMSSRPMKRGGLFSPGEKVECMDPSGTTLTRGGIYEIAESEICKLCGDGVMLTTGPTPTDSLCNRWWRADRFRSIRPPEDEVTNMIRQARPAPARPKVTEDA
jgi:hypothetical protein